VVARRALADAERLADGGVEGQVMDTRPENKICQSQTSRRRRGLLP
jgi:hypothetical protein